MLKNWCFALSLIFLSSSGCVHSQQLNFTNPIIDKLSADPAILRVGDHYYLTLSENQERELTIFKSPILTSFRNAEKTIAYTGPYRDIWASEMHLVDGELYIYFTMRNGPNESHKMNVIKADNASNPMGNWSQPIMLLDDLEDGGIDGTIMTHDNRHYFVWVSGGPTGLTIYIAPLINPTRVGRPIVLLRGPTEPWECNDGCVNEGPYFIYNRNVSYMVFSGSSTWDPGYSLSYMFIESGKDPMNVSNWEAAPGPVFSSNEEEDVFGPGHAAFTVSPDGTETWMVYHAMSHVTQLGTRIARIEKIDWDSNGKPVFPRPHGFNHPQPVPSGQTSV